MKDHEVKKGEHIPTYTLMKMLIDDPQHKDYDFYFILGSDLLGELDQWKYADKLRNEIKFIIFLRMGYKLKEKVLPKLYIIVYTSFVASSSSEIRNRIRALRKYGVLDTENLSKEKCFQKKKKDKEKNKGEQDKENNGIRSNKDCADRVPVSSDVSDGEMEICKVDVKKMYDLVKIKHLNTIDLEKNYLSEQKHRKLEEKYLGIYGIVPYIIIKYIQKHNLYND